VSSGEQAADGELEELQCDAEQSRQCSFSCGECSNTPLCTAEAQPLLDSKLHSGPATGEDTGEEGYPGEEGEGVCVRARRDLVARAGWSRSPSPPALIRLGVAAAPTGGQAAGKRIALCVTGAKEDGNVDAYAMRSIINCLLPSLRRDRTDLFVMASNGWRNVQVKSPPLPAASAAPLRPLRWAARRRARFLVHLQSHYSGILRRVCVWSHSCPEELRTPRPFTI